MEEVRVSAGGCCEGGRGEGVKAQFSHYDLNQMERRLDRVEPIVGKLTSLGNLKNSEEWRFRAEDLRAALESTRQLIEVARQQADTADRAAAKAAAA